MWRGIFKRSLLLLLLLVLLSQNVDDKKQGWKLKGRKNLITHLCRVLQHPRVLRNEPDVQAAAVHLQGTVGMRESGIRNNRNAVARIDAVARVYPVVEHLLGDLFRVRRVGHVEGAVDATTAAERGRGELVLGRHFRATAAVCTEVIVLEAIVARFAARRGRVVRVEAQVGILQQPTTELGLDVVLGTLHEQQLGQDLDEDSVHPGRHSVGLR